MMRHWNWGSAVALAYTAFAMSTVAFVAFAMEQRVDLVSADYYARSLDVDAQQAARVRAEALTGFTIEVSDDGRQVAIAWPPEQRGLVHGVAALYRPSDSTEDRTVPLAPDADGRQTLSFAGRPAGRWLLRVSWEAAQQAYYVERAVNVR